VLEKIAAEKIPHRWLATLADWRRESAGFGHVGIAQIGFTQVCSGQIHVRELLLCADSRLRDWRFCISAPLRFAPSQIGSPEIRALQVGAKRRHLCLRKRAGAPPEFR